MGSQLTKNYDVEKEFFVQGGLNNQWRVHRAKKKTGDDVAIFMYDKKNSKGKTAAQLQETFELLKRDALGLAKFRHPNVLSLIEAPIEDKSLIAYVTEAFEYNLSNVVDRKDLTPSEIDIKCMVLELIETVNFLHTNTKFIHMNLAPEHVYVTKEGKLKLAGLTFIKPFNSADPVQIQLDSQIPNLRFAAPEVSHQSAMVSAQADIFSIGCLIYYLVALNLGIRDVYILNVDPASTQQHKTECNGLDSRLQKMLQPLETNLQFIIKNMLSYEPQSRGSLSQYVSSAWFQDPLLKTIKYLENIQTKEQSQKVQFLQSINKVLDRFDKRTLVKKVIPLLVDVLKDPKLSPLVLASLFTIMQKDMLTTTEFRATVWPAICNLTRSKELPAQSIFYLIQNSEQLLKYAPQQEFTANLLPLLQKSIECGVPKLQLLALDKIQAMFKTLEYQTFKAVLLPRILSILENQQDILTKIKTLEFIKKLQDSIDTQSMQLSVFKTFEKVRVKETDPQICMLILQIYEKAAGQLGVDIIGSKILPSIIPLIVTGNVSRPQFMEMMKSVRSLLDKIEVSRLQTLPETSVEVTAAVQEGPQKLDDELGFLKENGGASPFAGGLEDLFADIGISKQTKQATTPAQPVFPSFPQPQQTFVQPQLFQQSFQPSFPPAKPAPQFPPKVQPSYNFSSNPSTAAKSDPFADIFSDTKSDPKPMNLSGWGDEPKQPGWGDSDPFSNQPSIPAKPAFSADPFANLIPKQHDPFAQLL